MLLNSPLINWQAPWWGAWREFMWLLHNTYTSGHGSVADNLNQHKPIECPVSFACQDDLDTGIAYEYFIYQNKICPTRDNWHDWFNGLAWYLFPHTKQRLNQLQYAQIIQDGVVNRRGSVRDAITLLDESGLLLQCHDEIWQSLCAKDWQRAFVELRPLWRNAYWVVFGHSIVEKLLTPYDSMCAKVMRIPNEVSPNCAGFDSYLSTHLTAEVLAVKPFTVVPLMGLPGWDPRNQFEEFYQNTSVFRPPKVG